MLGISLNDIEMTTIMLSFGVFNIRIISIPFKAIDVFGVYAYYLSGGLLRKMIPLPSLGPSKTSERCRNSVVLNKKLSSL